MRISDLANISIGIVLNNYFNETFLLEYLEVLKSKIFCSKIVIRFHPRAKFEEMNLPHYVEKQSGKLSLKGFVDTVDLVIAGNTSVVPDILNSGIPVIYLSDLDNLPCDSYGYIRDKLVLASTSFNWDINNITKFYFNKAWEARFNSRRRLINQIGTSDDFLEYYI